MNEKKPNKKNIITLIYIKNVNGETVAVIDYDILEYVSGDFNNPFSKDSKETTMEFIYKENAEFSIDKANGFHIME